MADTTSQIVSLTIVALSGPLSICFFMWPLDIGIPGANASLDRPLFAGAFTQQGMQSRVVLPVKLLPK